ncbi:hypothetical protein G7K_0525-t1 [Saitoella complicata NRRL Y-17804]|uniref:Uncharacterized protein n=1 Tax=Saitoella complicata (strain BCRC 22490 / CBS 7301 / JCM 7358 / NBRC 10748 / NRRL Y-17804) TaxID=698492 RepID=A0A0E9N907_SAICN|nr:hypothetical protein G7K_0525-t1 [Saitoella complicata NRRL Y-17804]
MGIRGYMKHNTCALYSSLISSSRRRIVFFRRRRVANVLRIIRDIHLMTIPFIDKGASKTFNSQTEDNSCHPGGSSNRSKYTVSLMPPCPTCRNHK